MTKIIDTHCHPQLGAYTDDREAVINRALEQGIGMIAVGTTVADSMTGVDLANTYPDQPIWAAVGVHPTDEDIANVDVTKIVGLIDKPKVVAIGETGLDYFHVDDSNEQQLQADVFEQHILLAKQNSLPLIVHCRDVPGKFGAYDTVLSLLNKHQVNRFVMHCYSGDWDHAEKFLELGGMLSFTGILTFPKSQIMQDVAKRVPSDRMMVETDAPFLAPVPFRGKRCEPRHVALVADEISKLRGLSSDEAAQITTNNAVRFFQLSKK